MKMVFQTLTDFTSVIIYQSITKIININQNKKLTILVCGGGRKKYNFNELY